MGRPLIYNNARVRLGQGPSLSNFLDLIILTKSYRYVRTRQITGEYRHPEIIDNPRLYDQAIQASLREIRNNENRFNM